MCFFFCTLLYQTLNGYKNKNKNMQNKNCTYPQ